MADTRGNNKNQSPESMHNARLNEFSNTKKQVIEQTQMGTENLKESTINYSLSSTGTKSDLMIHQRGLEYEKDIRTAPSNPKSSNGGKVEKAPGNVRKRVDYSNMDWGETFQKGGVAGILDKVLSNCSNMTPGQVDTRKTIGVLGIVGGVIYGQYKFYTSKNIGRKTKLGLTILPIFGSQFLTGEDPITLFGKLLIGGLSMNELKNKFGNAVGGLGTSGSEYAETTVPAMQSMMIFNPGTTAGNLRQITQTFRDDNKNRKNFYQQSCNKIRQEYGSQSLECFQATFGNNFNEEKRTNRLSSFGVTEGTSKNKTIYELANNASTNKTIIEKFLADNHLITTNDPIKKAEFYNFIKIKNGKNELITNRDLQHHTNDWFVSNIPQETNETGGIPSQEQANENPKIPEQQTQNIEIQMAPLQQGIEKGLSKSFNHFQEKYGSLLTSIAGIKQSSIEKFSPGITANIKSEICKVNGTTITLDLSDKNLKQVYNNFIYNLANSSSRLVKGKIKKYDWNGLTAELNKFRLEGNIDKFNGRKDNFSFVFNSLFEQIIPVLQSQGGNVKIAGNGREFTNINDAINSLELFS